MIRINWLKVMENVGNLIAKYVLSVHLCIHKRKTPTILKS